MDNNEYTDIEIIYFELKIRGKHADELLYDFRKKMKKTGKSLEECIAEYKENIEDEKAKDRFRKRVSRTVEIVYKSFLFLVVAGIIYLSFGKSEYIKLLEGNELMLIGLILGGIIVGAVVGSFWESNHSVFINGTLGVIGVLIGIAFVSHSSPEKSSWFYYILSVFIAITLLLFIFNFIVSFGGLMLTCIIAFGFGVSNLSLLKEIFSDNAILISVVIISLLFALMHQKILRNNFSRFIYLFLITLIGGIFGVVVLSDKLKIFESSDFWNKIVFSLVGSILVVLFAEFIDRQAENAD